MSVFRKKGLSIIEVLVALTIVSVFIVAIAHSYSILLRLAFANISNIKAVFILEETVEAVKFLKTSDWDNYIAPLDPDVNYFLSFDGTTWYVDFSQSSLIDGTFERVFSLGDVYRGSDGRILDLEGPPPPEGFPIYPDEETKQLTAQVFWNSSGATTTKSIVTYISKLN